VDQLLTLATNHPFWAWAALVAALLGSETLNGSGWLLWPAACAAVMAVLSMVFPFDPLQAMGLFAAITIASTYLGRRFIPQLAGHDDRDINDAAGRLIGHHGKTVGAFSGRAGRVFIDGKEWAAMSDSDLDLPAGTAVEVTGLDGARLKVKAV